MAIADLNEILIFARVVQAGSFTAGATSLGMPKSTVSRKVFELEERIGARLLQRTTRKLSLTDIGRAYFERCSRIVAEVEEAELAVTQLQSTPRGLLRVTTPLTFRMLGPVLSEFLRRYPQVEVDMVCTDRRVDIIEERFDLAIRAGSSPDSTLIVRRLGTVRLRMVAAPAFLKQIGTPKTPADLQRHDCIVFSTAREGGVWTLSAGGKSIDVPVRARLVVNDYDMLHEVVRTGCGFALLPDYLCHDDLKAGRLRRVLDEWTPPEIPVYAIYPSARHLTPKVIALVDLIQERLTFSGRPRQ